MVVLRWQWLKFEDADLYGVGLRRGVSLEPCGELLELIFVEEVSAVVYGARRRNSEVAQCLDLRI